MMTTCTAPRIDQNTARFVAQAVIENIVRCLINHQQMFSIDGKTFLPLSVSVEDGSGMRWLIRGYFVGQGSEPVDVYVDFALMQHTFEF